MKQPQFYTSDFQRFDNDTTPWASVRKTRKQTAKDLMHIADYLELRVKEVNFDMHDYCNIKSREGFDTYPDVLTREYVVKVCNADDGDQVVVLCAIGWVGLMKRFNKRGLTLTKLAVDRFPNAFTHEYGLCYEGDERFASIGPDFFKLTHDELDWIFMTEGYKGHNNITKKRVIKHLRSSAKLIYKHLDD